MERQPPSAVRVWDLPTRLFHWALALLVVASWVSGQFGGVDWLPWHFRSGYLIFALLLFRLLWGFAGDRYALFSSFRLSPSRALAHLREPQRVAGHSPAGAWSVYALLLCVGFQVITGLLSSDGDFTEGPWAQFVSERTVRLMSSVHTVNRWVLAALVAAHVAAIAWYRWKRGVALTAAMWTGTMHGVVAESATDDRKIRLRAALLAAWAGVLVAYVVLL